MAGGENGDSTPLRRAFRRTARNWAPYLLTSTTLFITGLVVGAAVGTERESPLLPAPAGTNPYAGLGTAELFLHNGGVALYLVLGALLLGVPTVYLLLFNGFLLGAGVVEFARTYGTIETLAMLLPHAIVELSALLLAAAISFRWCHLGWRVASASGRDTTMPRTILETVGAVLVVTVFLFVAAVIEANVSSAVAAAVT